MYNILLNFLSSALQLGVEPKAGLYIYSYLPNKEYSWAVDSFNVEASMCKLFRKT